VRPGDVVIKIDGHPIASLAEMLRSIWQLGSAGVVVPLTVRRGTRRLDLEIRSGDRAIYLRKGTLQ
jgi:S1-C subfamily serine protease